MQTNMMCQKYLKTFRATLDSKLIWYFSCNCKFIWTKSKNVYEFLFHRTNNFLSNCQFLGEICKYISKIKRYIVPFIFNSDSSIAVKKMSSSSLSLFDHMNQSLTSSTIFLVHICFSLLWTLSFRVTVSSAWSSKTLLTLDSIVKKSYLARFHWMSQLLCSLQGYHIFWAAQKLL